MTELTDDDLQLAEAMERAILGGDIRLPCNCILETICTMPYTYWVRLKKYVHRCPRHPKGGNHLLLVDPSWATTDGEQVPGVLFTQVFNELVAQGAQLVPGFHIFEKGKARQVDSLISVEGSHYITATGHTEKIAPLVLVI